MAIETVAVLSTGDMGHAVGRVLREGGLRVVTALAGRSARSRELACQAGIEDVGDEVAVVRAADVVLSVLPPARAVALAERLADALRRTSRTPLVVDCNAIAPATACRIGEMITAAGGRFVDAGIIGPPPTTGGTATRVYASGEHAAEFAALAEHGLTIRVIGAVIGQASGLKMCYAALTKGLTALATELLVAGERLGLSAPLRAELELSQSALLRSIERSVPGMPPKAYRWIGEMEEIAQTFADVGLTPRLLLGVADMYRFVEATPLGAETPEARRLGGTLDEVVRLLAAHRSEPAQP